MIRMGQDNTGNFEEAKGFRFLQSGETMMLADAQARQKIVELEEKITELEARRQIFVGTTEEINALASQGMIRVGDLAITTDDENVDGSSTDDGSTDTNTGSQ